MVAESVIATIQPDLLARASQLAGSRSAGEELLQEAYVRLVAAGDRFSEVDGPGRISKWMRATLKNVWSEGFRAARREPDIEVLLMAGIPVGDRHGESLLEFPVYDE